MKKIAFLTSKILRNLIPDEQPLVQEFLSRRYSIEPIIWDQHKNWNEFDFVIVRNTWDYIDKYDLFLQVLKEIKASSAKLINPYETLVWNSNKTYLEELTLKGVPVVTSFQIKQLNLERLQEILMMVKTEDFVIKPTVGAGGQDTFRMKTTLTTEEQEMLLKALGGRDVLIQPFIQSILTEGEYSYVFVNKKFSHAILKTAKAGEFRIHEEFGGRVDSYRPTHQEIEEVTSILNKIPYPMFYCRIDVARNEKGKLVLMELEAVEPQLFFTWSSNSANLFVDEFQKSYIYKK
ncbi:MAG: hypothetical protein JNM93_06865 [Bacteriovoracaceae bacterium]|nr:hypothetical protein [Bacteriovoracaceae bacterium]